METNPACIGPMIKVRLAVNALPAEGTEAESAKGNLEFIFGLATQGLTPFEKALSEKRKGDSIRMRIDTESQYDILGHLACGVFQSVRLAPPVVLEFTVTDLEKADNRELIKAMAQLSSCDSGCDCGCGC